MILEMIVMTLGLQAARPADAIYHNGAVHGRDGVAQALAVQAGRIAALGEAARILADHRGPGTRVVDLAGRTILPGLIDAHAHLISLGALRRQLDARDVRSYADLVALVRRRAAQSGPGEWILGGRWDHSLWGRGEMPTHHELSEAVPDRPVFLVRVDGHAALANRRAMELAGITRDTEDPPGGDILRDERGDATGLFVDRAMDLVRKAIPRRTAPVADLILDAQEACLRAGLVSVHDMGVDPEEMEAYRKLEREGKLKLRMYLALSGGADAAAMLDRAKPSATPKVVVRACKLYLDGAMGSRGAWLLEPYSDRPVDDKGRPNVGLPLMEPSDLREAAKSAIRNGFQICVHAIGDRANREALDAFEAAGVRPEHRFRIEHAQCVAPADIPRFAKLGVLPSMQPTHATSDMRWAQDRVGPDRLRGCYAWRRFLDAGSRIAGGSDFPVESENPFLGLYAAVTRQDLEGRPEGGWMPDQRLRREEALALFTTHAAYAAFEEGEAGGLALGLRADFLILPGWEKLADREIASLAPLATVIGGEEVFRRD